MALICHLDKNFSSAGPYRVVCLVSQIRQDNATNAYYCILAQLDITYDGDFIYVCPGTWGDKTPMSAICNELSYMAKNKGVIAAFKSSEEILAWSRPSRA
jgi:hypothetical protein